MTFNESMTFKNRLYKPPPLKPQQYSVNGSADNIKHALYTIRTNSTVYKLYQLYQLYQIREKISQNYFSLVSLNINEYIFQIKQANMIKKEDEIYKEIEYKNIILSSTNQSTCANPITEELGKVELRIEDIPKGTTTWLTRYSEANKLYHIESGRNGHFCINVCYNDIKLQPSGTYFIRSILVKANSPYKHFPVDRICEKHKENDPITDKQPIQPTKGTPKEKYSFCISGTRPSLIHWCEKPNENNTIRLTMNVMFPCMDTCCNTSHNSTSKNAEAARDLKLVQTLENLHNNQINVIRRHTINIWPKARIANRELCKKERRKPKGNHAHRIKSKIDELPNQVKKNNGTPNQFKKVKNTKLARYSAELISEMIVKLKKDDSDLKDLTTNQETKVKKKKFNKYKYHLKQIVQLLKNEKTSLDILIMLQEIKKIQKKLKCIIK